MKEFIELVEVMKKLRDECPWDREQSLSTLRSYLLEEAYECLDAMNEFIQKPTVENRQHLREELGDVLLQILFQSKLLNESSNEDELKALMIELRNKLVRRHPHIFESAKAGTAEEVHKRWNEIKKSEKPKQTSLLGDLPKDVAALLKAQKIGERSNKVKFDWETPDQVWKDVESELKELLGAKTQADKESELGDILFSLVQWARHQNLNAEVALAGCNQRFLERFHKMEEFCEHEKLDFSKLNLNQKDELWQRAKKALKK